jgi:hypothetical protein
MLIRDVVAGAVADGKLVPIQPIAPWSGKPRGFLVCAALAVEMQRGREDGDPKVRARWATLEAAMSYFVEGHAVTDDLIKQLIPAKFEHWELRSRKPRPSLRVFGRFVDRDIFVGTHIKNRDELGAMWSVQFEHEKLVCEDHWKAAGLPDPYSDAPHFRYSSYMSNASKKLRLK